MSPPATLEPRQTPRTFGAAATRSEGVAAWIERTTAIPPGAAWVVGAGMWFADVETFRDAEDQALASNFYSEKLGEHRVILGQLISRGKRSLAAAKPIELPADFSSFSIDDVRATVASLETTHRCQHSRKMDGAVGARVSALFDVEEREN